MSELKKYEMTYRTSTSVSLPIGRYISEEEAIKDIPNAVLRAWGQIYSNVKCSEIVKNKYNEHVADVSYTFNGSRHTGILIFKIKNLLVESYVF
jgi:hypothetical protein